ncbi:MAG: TIGR02147 family protein [Fibrobacteres bacterium]|nr:TIGR02147 family protein [Fibrobacterota bacterium]
MDKRLSVFEYTDFRLFLRAFYDAEKLRNPKFSHRFIANKLALSTSNFLLLVMQGKRNISSDLRFRISQFLKFDKSETEYFESMVNFCQASSIGEKERHYSRMLEQRKLLKIDDLSDRQFEYYSEWYHPIVREMAVMNEFEGRADLISKAIEPHVGLRQIKKSISLLLKIGLLKKAGTKFVQSSPVVSTGPEVVSMGVLNFHRMMAHRAAEALDTFPRHQRNITSCTVGISQEGYDKIVKKLSDCRKEIMKIAEADPKTDRVCQINFQLFPLNKIKAAKETI